MDLSALQRISAMKTPMSARELFTRHNLMMMDCKPYTGDSRGNIGGNTKKNLIEWLGQSTDFSMVGNKILIESIKEAPNISHITNKLLYKPYVQSLFYDFINKEVKNSANINHSPIEISLINDYFPQKFNVLGNMYNAFMEAIYNDSMNDYFSNFPNIQYQPYHYYVMQSLRNSIRQNIDNAIKGISDAGINKRMIYTLAGKPITAEQTEFISNTYVKPIMRKHAEQGMNYHYYLTGAINRQIKNDFKKEDKRKSLYNVLHIEKYSPICETWEIEVTKDYQIVKPPTDIEFCKRKLNENARHKILKISGYDTLLKYYNIQRDIEGKEFFLLPEELAAYTKNFPFHHQNLSYYLNDLDTLIKDIC